VNVDYKNIEDSNYDLPAGAVLAPILGERLVGARGLGRRNGHWKKNLVGHMHKHAIFHIKPTYNHISITNFFYPECPVTLTKNFI